MLQRVFQAALIGAMVMPLLASQAVSRIQTRRRDRDQLRRADRSRAPADLRSAARAPRAGGFPRLPVAAEAAAAARDQGPGLQRRDQCLVQLPLDRHLLRIHRLDPQAGGAGRADRGHLAGGRGDGAVRRRAAARAVARGLRHAQHSGVRPRGGCRRSARGVHPAPVRQGRRPPHDHGDGAVLPSDGRQPAAGRHRLLVGPWRAGAALLQRAVHRLRLGPQPVRRFRAEGTAAAAARGRLPVGVQADRARLHDADRLRISTRSCRKRCRRGSGCAPTTAGEEEAGSWPFASARRNTAARSTARAAR